MPLSIIILILILLHILHNIQEDFLLLPLSFRKEMKAWKFHLATDVIVQKSSNSDVLDLPLVTIRSAGYFEHLFRFKQTGGKLNTQIGVDVNYNTLYHPYSYMPATGRFYRQDQEFAGNYPFINVFLNFKVQRTRSLYYVRSSEFRIDGLQLMK